MNKKIKNYVDVLFSDIPRSKKANELKEELLSNMSERFEDYVRQGKTENQAYSLVISNMGEIDEMLAQLMPDAEFIQKASQCRKRVARNTAISVAMYMIGFCFFLAFAGIGVYIRSSDIYPLVGLIIFLAISAIATAILVYSHMSTPPEYKDYDRMSSKEPLPLVGRYGRLLKSILSVYWTLVTFVYFALSFLTGRWDVTWGHLAFGSSV